MAISRMLLCGLSIAVGILLWPPSSLAEMCQDDMNKIYEQVNLLDSMDYTSNQTIQATVRSRAQDFINKSLPPFKAKCPMSSGSMNNLENGKYLRDLAAAREIRKKAHRHIKSGGDIPDSELFEDFSVQQ